MAENALADAVSAVCSLNDPTRLALYQYVIAQGDAVGRDHVAQATGISRHSARFHLDRLADAGLLDVEFRRLSGRRGPGAGHPAKLYRKSDVEMAVTVPERRYEIAGHMLATAFATAAQGDVSLSDALKRAARDTARAMAGPTDRGLPGAIDKLADAGFAPRAVPEGYVLGNCPYRAVAEAAPEVVCGMTLDLVAALLDESGASRTSARLDPAPGRCCVTMSSA
jgi:predicted ArsR family transcriptional regulator